MARDVEHRRVVGGRQRAGRMADAYEARLQARPGSGAEVRKSQRSGAVAVTIRTLGSARRKRPRIALKLREYASGSRRP